MTSTDELFERAKATHSEGAIAEAETLYRRILELSPHHAGAIHGMGGLAYDSGRYAAAVEFLNIALEIEPARLTARMLLCLALKQQGQLDLALLEADRIVAQDPAYASGHYERGWILWERGRAGEAGAAFGTAMALDGGLELDFTHRVMNALMDCDWDKFQNFDALIDDVQAPPVHPFLALLLSSRPQLIKRATQRYAAALFPSKPPLWAGGTREAQRIRIAYIGGDFEDHAVGRHIAGVLEAHDRSRFEVMGLSHGPNEPSPIRARLEAACDLFVDMKDETPEAIARMLHARNVDIAVALSGYTANAQPEVLAWRPCPVQVTFLGYPGTLGADYVDYLIADRVTVPQAEQDAYVEQVVWMPDAYHPTDDKEPRPAVVSTRADEGLSEDQTVFMAYGPPHKISRTMFNIWMRILRSVPGSSLWLASGSEHQQEALRRMAAEGGVEPDRLIFARWAQAREDHLARFHLADIFLDTLPYNAHATACDALWMGTPIVTCRGQAFAGRVCASLVSAAGFPELVAENLVDYEALAVRLALDGEALAVLKDRLRAKTPNSALFNTARYTRALEAAYERMVKLSRSGQPPQAFEVSPIIEEIARN